ncbi:MAG: PqqD family peptide modification chaperone [Candidatus Omnitrophota bacterium]
MKTFFDGMTKTHYIVKGDRECIFRQFDNNEYLLSVYKDGLQGDYQDEQGNKTDELVPFYLLSQSAAIVWHLLENCPTPENLLSLIKGCYADHEYQEIVKDLDKFLNNLYRFHLISLSESRPSVNTNASVFSSCDRLELKQMLKKEKQKYAPFSIEPLIINQHVFTELSACLPPPAEQP